MMFFNDTEVAAHQERLKDLSKEVAHERLIKIAQSSQSDNRALYVSVIHWLGIKMVEWGLKLNGQPQSTPIRCC